MAGRVEKRRVSTRAIRVVAAAAWLGATLSAGVVCLSVAVLSTATFFGEPPTEEMWREGLLFSLAGAAVASAGPLGVWFTHRRRGWVYLAGVLGAVGVGGATYIWFGFAA